MQKLVAQLLVVRASGMVFDQQIRYPVWEPKAEILRSWVQDLGVGGVILLGGSALELAQRTQQLQGWAQNSEAKIPLLLAADVEEGVGQRFAGATWFPPPFALGMMYAQGQNLADQARDFARQMGTAIAQESLAVGLNWVLAPVVDVNNNPDNPVINVRAFGEDPATVADLTTAFLQGMESYPVLGSAKHFPGHGDTATDSHLELPVIPHDDGRLSEIELVPFQKAIAAGVDTVMTAHLQIPAWDKDWPITLSRKVLTGQLRERLGFDGIIVTDALVMGAIANRYGANEAPVLALEAGADILLMPADPPEAITAICKAVKTGRISRGRIEESVGRIWTAKAKVQGDKVQGDKVQDNAAPNPIKPDPIHQLATQEHIDLDQQILKSSLVQGNGYLTLPIAQGASQKTVAKESMENLGTLAEVANPDAVESPPGINWIAVDDGISADFLGQHTPAIAQPRQWGFTDLRIIDSYSPVSAETLTTWLSDRPLGPMLLQLFVRGNPFRGSAGLTQTALTTFAALQKTGQLCGVILYGSPYLLDTLRPQLIQPDGTTKIPYRFNPSQTPAAQGIALDALVEC
ncbi:MAG: glycoside hydrolase family 3 N-terminal domain-containing protein [Cyanobacteria bacterium P01_F01_bin.153]